MQAQVNPLMVLNILAKGNFNIGVSTAADGNYLLKLAQDKYTVKFSHVAYRDTTLIISTKKWDQTSVKLDIKLVFAPILFQGADVFGTPDTIYGHYEYNVGDFGELQNVPSLPRKSGDQRWGSVLYLTAI